LAPFSPAGRASTDAWNVRSASQRASTVRSSVGNDGWGGTEPLPVLAPSSALVTSTLG
jgi:hypothetical protein